MMLQNIQHHICRLFAICTHAKCESNKTDDALLYRKFIPPKVNTRTDDVRSHYNFIADSLPYLTDNGDQLSLYDEYMNNVLSLNNMNKWKNITKCLSNDVNDEYKQLMCKSLISEYYITDQDAKNAKNILKSAYDSIDKDYNLNNLHNYHREELYVFGFYEWIVNGNKINAQNIFEYICNKYPYDLFAAKRAQKLAISNCDNKSTLSIFLNLKEYHSLNGKYNRNKNKIPSAYFNGSLSFGYEQMGYLYDAEIESKQGLIYHIDDNWNQHCLIHSRYFQKNTQNDIKNIICFILNNCSKYWDIDEKRKFMTTHNWWHVALLYLELNDIESAINIFKKHIWRNNLNRRAEQIGALSMLWIIQMIINTKTEKERIKYKTILNEIDNLYPIIMEYIYETHKTVNVGYKLYDLLFMRGLIEMKSKNFKYNKYDKCLQKMKKDINKLGDNKYIGIANAMELIYDTNNIDPKRLDKAYDILSNIIDDLNSIGGSREQRFVFDQMYIDLLIKNNQKNQLKKYLNSFLTKYPLPSLSRIAQNL